MLPQIIIKHYAHGDINFEQRTIVRFSTTNHPIAPSCSVSCMIIILFNSQHMVERKIGLKQPSYPSIIELFIGHVWEKPPAHKPCHLTLIYSSLIPP